MKHTLSLGVIGVLVLTLGLGAQTQEKKPDKKPPLPGDADGVVSFLLKQFDKDMDGKLSKDENRGKIADGFAKLDSNSDGFLDRAELRVIARVMLDQKKGPGGFGPFGGFGQDPNDFDGYDKDADGRLTKDELKNSRWATRFAEIDTNMDGRIDRREWEAFQRKNTEKKKE